VNIVRRCIDASDVLRYLNAMDAGGAEVRGVVPSDGKSSPKGSTLMIFARVRNEDHMVEIDARYCGYIKP
jgi:hypothetical protein